MAPWQPEVFPITYRGMLTNKRAAVPQAAAWSAHFLAICIVRPYGRYDEASAEKLRQEHLCQYKGTENPRVLSI